MQRLILEVSKSLTSSPLDFDWKDVSAHFGPTESENSLMRSVAGKTTSGTIALGCGVMLWGVLRIGQVADVEDYVCFLAATFAATYEPNIINVELLKSEPIAKSPKEIAVLMEMRWLLVSAVWPTRWTTTTQQPCSEIFHLIYLVRHILDSRQRKAFNRWLAVAIERLNTISPRPEPMSKSLTSTFSPSQRKEYLRNFWGQPVAPDMLLLNLEQPDAELAFADFLAGQAWASNRFVKHSPEWSGWKKPDAERM